MANRYLVCGDRNWQDVVIINQIIEGLITTSLSRPVIIEGCAKGADKIACAFPSNYVDHEHYPADWDQYGRAAGPIRNRKMLNEGNPSIVFAFHDDLQNSKGTKDMVSIAKTKGVPVYVISHG